MAIRDHIPLGIGVGAIVATMLYGTCGTDQAMEREFAGLNQRFDQIDQRFDHVDQRFDHVDQRFDQIDQRFDDSNQRFDSRFNSLADQMQQGFTEVHRRIDDTNERIDDLQTDVRELRSIHLGTADTDAGVD